jgi:hypothetical protein
MKTKFFSKFIFSDDQFSEQSESAYEIQNNGNFFVIHLLIFVPNFYTVNHSSE